MLEKLNISRYNAFYMTILRVSFGREDGFIFPEYIFLLSSISKIDFSSIV
jgi:hypothetical protein